VELPSFAFAARRDPLASMRCPLRWRSARHRGARSPVATSR
jgi:hypothetical protein